MILGDSGADSWDEAIFSGDIFDILCDIFWAKVCIKGINLSPENTVFETITSSHFTCPWVSDNRTYPTSNVLISKDIGG